MVLLTGLLLAAAQAVAEVIHPGPLAVSQMVADWQRAKAYTKEYLDAIPADGLAYKPNADVRTFAEQMLHISMANFAFAAEAAGKANPYKDKNLEKMPEFATKEALDRVVMESYDFVISALQGTSEAKMGEKIKVFGMEMSREQAFSKAFEHQTHHRGQATLYLRMKGIKPPNERLF
jgi:uncharacterized damage-inducible protein DinB